MLAFALTLALAAAPATAAKDAPWSPASAPALPDKTAAMLDAVVDHALAGEPVAGVSAAVLFHGAVWHAARGDAVLPSRGLRGAAAAREATARTSYRIASITKTFTAVSVMQLAADNKIDLGAEIQRYVPAYPDKSGPVTVKELLSHTGGVAHYRSMHDAMTTTPLDTAQSIALFAKRPLAAPPGQRFLYSSFGYNLLGAAVEEASGVPFGTYLEEHVLGPLGMTRTGLEALHLKDDDVAAGYRLAGGRIVPAEPLDISSRFASGGMRADVDDLLRYAHALLAGTLVDKEVFARMTTPVVTRDGRQADYGMGFAVYPLHGRRVVAHAGGQPGTSSLLFMLPDDDLIVVLLTNLQGSAPLLTRISSSVAELLVDDGAPFRDLYAADPYDAVAFDGMSRIMSYGLVHDDASAPPAAVTRAFAALPALFARTRLPFEAREALRDAYHPAFGRVSIRVGAEMARVLEAARGAAGVRALAHDSPAAFFHAYVDACAKARCAHPLPPALNKLAARLDAAWKKTPEALRDLRPEAVPGDVAAAERLLKPLSGLPAHPDFVEDLRHLADRRRAAGDAHGAARALALAEELQPRSPWAHLGLAESHVVAGDPGGAAAEMHKALTLPLGRADVTKLAVHRRNEHLRFLEHGKKRSPDLVSVHAAVLAALPPPPATTTADPRRGQRGHQAR